MSFAAVGVTGGEAVAEASFGGYRPARPRATADPRNRDEYLLQLAGRAHYPARRAESSHGS